jgi:glycosyltransferase involved in cell wall biosynthesis
MRIALLSCREFKIPGGAERLEIDIALALNASIVCLDVDPEFQKIYPISQSVTFHPLKHRLPGEPYKQFLGMLLFRRIKLDYDFFIIMDDMSLRYLTHRVPHIYYMHTPRRILYDMYYPSINEYHFLKKYVMIIILSIVRYCDRKFVCKYVENIACNSHNTRNRIWKTYQRDAKVLYPPVHLKTDRKETSGDFWLSVTRVDKWKRVELQLEVFKLIPQIKLVIVGKVYPKYKNIIKNAPSNVIFLDTVNDKELDNLYASCRGFLTTAIDEDFGITPLEAMAVGKPVVAVKEGGYLETVVDGVTGLLVGPVPQDIADAITYIDKNPEKFSYQCKKRAELFEYNIFQEELKKYWMTIVDKKQK